MTKALEEYSARNAEEYLDTRVNHRIESYRKKGDIYRYSYQIVAGVSAISAATVPVLINFQSVEKIYPTILSLVVTILVSLEGLLHLREHWKNYDLMKIFLRHESCLFQARAGIYREKDDKDAFLAFVERVEEAISRERSLTINMRTARPSGSDSEHSPGTNPKPPTDAPKG